MTPLERGSFDHSLTVIEGFIEPRAVAIIGGFFSGRWSKGIVL